MNQNEGAPDNPNKKLCYCDIPLSNSWISISGTDGHHPENPRTEFSDDCSTIENILISTDDEQNAQKNTLQTMKDHANRNLWYDFSKNVSFCWAKLKYEIKSKALYNVNYRQMDCIYCGIKHQKLLQDEARNSRHYYEYTVCQYNNFVAKLFNSICQAYELSNQVLTKRSLIVTFLVGRTARRVPSTKKRNFNRRKLLPCRK